MMSEKGEFLLFISGEFRIETAEFFFFGWTNKAFSSQHEFLDENIT